MPPTTTTPPIPKLSELAEMYNNTIAGASAAAIDTPPPEATAAPLHIPTKLEDFLPSIFLKDEPPHGCLKNGRKPTFREWATKMLGGSEPAAPADPPTSTSTSRQQARSRREQAAASAFFNELRGARSRSDSRSGVSKRSRTRGKEEERRRERVSRGDFVGKEEDQL